MTIDLTRLAEPFAADQIHWRAQNLTRDGNTALALAYLDARDVMDRLDAVCGAANWRDRFEVHGDKTICYLAIRIENEWIEKADGGGDTDIEGEKGALSGALKRAAVKWGIGRYLYDLGDTWVACESYDAQGKKRWKKWTENPWAAVRNAERFLPSSQAKQARQPSQSASVTGHTTAGGRLRRKGERFTEAHDIQNAMEALLANVAGKATPDALEAWAKGQAKMIGALPDKAFDEFMDAYEGERAQLMAERVAA